MVRKTNNGAVSLSPQVVAAQGMPSQAATSETEVLRAGAPDAAQIKVWLTTGEAAARYGLSESLLEKLRLTPSASPPFCRVGRAIRYPITEFDGWMAARMVNLQASASSHPVAA